MVFFGLLLFIFQGYFVSETGTAIGVADGVGGWAEHGVGIQVFKTK